MSISYDGNSLVFDGTVTITNFTDPTTGVVTLTLTPSGGLGSIPALVNGQPGLPPIFDDVTVTTLTVGSSATASVTQTSAGGPGTASHYNLDLGIPVGATGAAGTNATIAGASDLTTTAAKGDILAVTGVSPTAFQYKAFPWANVYNVVTPTEASSSGVALAQLASISLPAESYDYMVLAFAKTTVTGTANTAFYFTAVLDPTGTSSTVGFDSSVPGIAAQKLVTGPTYGALVGTGYGQVAAGDTASVVLQISQHAATSDAWSTAFTSFTVVTVPVGWP